MVSDTTLKIINISEYNGTVLGAIPGLTVTDVGEMGNFILSFIGTLDTADFISEQILHWGNEGFNFFKGHEFEDVIFTTYPEGASTEYKDSRIEAFGIFLSDPENAYASFIYNVLLVSEEGLKNNQDVTAIGADGNTLFYDDGSVGFADGTLAVNFGYDVGGSEAFNDEFSIKIDLKDATHVQYVVVDSNGDHVLDTNGNKTYEFFSVDELIYHEILHMVYPNEENLGHVEYENFITQKVNELYRTPRGLALRGEYGDFIEVPDSEARSMDDVISEVFEKTVGVSGNADDIKGTLRTFEGKTFYVGDDLRVVEVGNYGATFGSVLGSTIGRHLGGDDAFETITYATFLGALGKNLGQTVDVMFGTGSLGDGLEAAFDDVGLDLGSAGVGAISSFLIGELIGELGVDGIPGDVLETTAGFTITAIANNSLNGLPWDNGLETVQFGNIIGSYIGSKLASEVIGFDTVGVRSGPLPGRRRGLMLFQRPGEQRQALF